MKNPFKQSQFELFPGTPGVQPKRAKSPFFGWSLILSFENIILLGIIFLMGMVVAFSFGVEKGKSINKSVSVKALLEGPDYRAQAYDELRQEEEADIAVSETIATDQGQAVNIIEISQNEKNMGSFEKKVDKTLSLAKIYTVQVASFKQKSMAEAEATRLQGRSYDAFVEKKGSYYIVCVGYFEEKRQAQSLLKALRKKYSDCYIRSL